jgi:hypothetical protein
MVPAIYNLPTGYRGDSYGPIVFKFYDSTGNAIFLQGVSGNLQVKEGMGLSSILSWSTSDSSMFITGNEVRLNPKAGSCMLMQPKTYSYDFQLSSGEMTRTYLKGSFPLISDITQI